MARVALVAVLVWSVGCGADTQSDDSPARQRPESDAESSWDAREGDDWLRFESGYQDGWFIGCDVGFYDSAGTDELYDGNGDVVTRNDCHGGLADAETNASEIPREAPASPESVGEDLGTTDGCHYLFEQLSIDGATLYYANEPYDASVCP